MTDDSHACFNSVVVTASDSKRFILPTLCLHADIVARKFSFLCFYFPN